MRNALVSLELGICGGAAFAWVRGARAACKAVRVLRKEEEEEGAEVKRGKIAIAKVYLGVVSHACGRPLAWSEDESDEREVGW